MLPLVTQIIGGIFLLIIGSLITYFVTTATTKNIQKAIALELVGTHEQIHHKVTMDLIIGKHENSCEARKDYKAMRDGIVFLVTQAKGSTHDIGLS